MKLDSICAVPGIRVGHAQNNRARTGCSVILPEKPAVCGVDVRGSAPGTREIEAIKPVRLVPAVHAVFLTGGSAFGLDAAGGVQSFLEEQGVGFDVGVTTVPIVPTAVIFDLYNGDPKIRPDKAMGYQAAAEASPNAPVRGRLGAGCGATVGKVLGAKNAMHGGIGSAAQRNETITVGAFVVVNAFGNIVDPENGSIVAGARNEGGSFVDAEEFLKNHKSQLFPPLTNTTLAIVATDGFLSKEGATKVAEMAQDGLSRVIRPVHTPYDGDIVFVLSTGSKSADVLSIGVMAAQTVAEAIIDAVRSANNI